MTALFAATIAVAQSDIKKVLAYSTVPQLGHMFLAVGTGAFVAAIFHMVTHAFFKALMFLGSGSVIHGMHHEQDMRRMGALRKVMPITVGTFIIGWLAIAGVPPFAGFWSKDEILLFTLARSPVLYVIGLVTAILTAYYMTRQVIMVFFWEASGKATPKTTVRTVISNRMSLRDHVVPTRCAVSAVGRGGIIQLPSFGIIPKGLRHCLEDWLHPVVAPGEAVISGTSAYDAKVWLALLAIGCAVAGIALGVLVYGRRKLRAIEPAILADGWRYDRSVSAFMGGPGHKMFEAIAWFDAKIVDGAVNGVATAVRSTSGSVRRIQTGNVRSYAGVIGIGVVLILMWFVVLSGGDVMAAATSTEVAFPLLSMMIVVPVVGALIIAVLSNRRPEYSKLVALLASVGTGALSVGPLRTSTVTHQGSSSQASTRGLNLGNFMASRCRRNFSIPRVTDWCFVPACDRWN